ncbi:MAG: adenosylcobinamide-GDP ribazoletransferase [Methanomicrobiales archaeon HGW-Methanomicrobiales-5]|nr:MAG: adenosylcobinamide-GDP ribazoletransferase [Methanomicrobiales archaeon HGW-Methanomicrobiales-5]
MKILQSLLQFTTILPLGKAQDLEQFARHSYLYPVAGYVIGALVALPVFFIADRTIAAAVAIALIMLISGAHHFDGLLDLGDGLMAHGDHEKRIKALTDRYIGAGGVTAGLVITLLLFAGFQASTSLVFAIIIGEVCAKFSMTVLTAYGTPFKEGIHSYLHQFSQPHFPLIAALLCAPLLFIPIAPLKLVGAFLAALVCPAILLIISKRLFGGVNGDVVGAANEITRACAVLALVIL